MAENAYISIIVCCYNAINTLPDTLASLQAQTYRDIEILIVNDASTDGTVEMVKEAQRGDPRIRIVHHSSNKGLAHGRNTGVEAAANELLTFIDADDIAMPNMVERLAEELMADDTRLGVSAYRVYFDDDRDLGLQRIGPTSRDAYLKIYNGKRLLFLSYPNLVRRRDVLAVGGYRVDVMSNAEGIRHADFCEDLDLWCRMSDLSSGGRYFITLQESLSRYRKPAGSMSTRNVKHMQNKMRWIKDCLLRRRAGQTERSLEAFLASRTVWQRLADVRADTAAGIYKKAGFAFAKRNYVTLAWYLLLVGVLSPKLLHQKIATQRAG